MRSSSNHSGRRAARARPWCDLAGCWRRRRRRERQRRGHQEVANSTCRSSQLKEQYPQMFEGADAEGRLLDFQQRLLDNMINNVLHPARPPRSEGIEVTDDEVDDADRGAQDRLPDRRAVRSRRSTSRAWTSRLSRSRFAISC